MASAVRLPRQTKAMSRSRCRKTSDQMTEIINRKKERTRGSLVPKQNQHEP
ncbi:hypothetical protein [Oryza sativa Japonica Group]|uniref:Uncharacterized protein n=1 Tax=Oryza sativa subsp. japonica TaxID=39947 RepID=Q5JKV0_ORYSJ|nr:hypothetical protein [Oryza sativa Japonica Group]BAD87891.1 hypothetical protein [Oryza sativa Japonica Group]